MRRLRQRAGALRESLDIPKRFKDDSITLGATRSARAPAYENSVVCARVYDCNNLPAESELYDDLIAMLRLYSEVPNDYDDEVNALVFAGGEHKPLVRPYKIGQEENTSGKPGKDIDGEARRQRIERRKKVHRRVLDDVALAALHAELKADFSEYADLIVDGHWLIEVKSVGEKDAVARVRGAIAQLFHYKFLHRQECPHAELVAVFSRKPLTQEGSDELVEFMTEIGIIACWQEPSGRFASLDERAPAWLVAANTELAPAV